MKKLSNIGALFLANNLVNASRNNVEEGQNISDPENTSVITDANAELLTALNRFFEANPDKPDEYKEMLLNNVIGSSDESPELVDNGLTKLSFLRK